MSNYETPWTVACQPPPFMRFSRQEYWSGLPCPSPGFLPNPGTKLRSPTLQAVSLRSEPPGKPRKFFHVSLNWFPWKFCEISSAGIVWFPLYRCKNRSSGWGRILSKYSTINVGCGARSHNSKLCQWHACLDSKRPPEITWQMVPTSYGINISIMLLLLL